MMKHVTGSGCMVLILLASLYHPEAAAAHGAASGEDDPCLRRVGDRLVHFSTYQPQFQLKEHYCTDIPKEGNTFLVVDLVDPALRNESVWMRVMKKSGNNGAEDQIVADIQPGTHPDGVLRSEVRLEEGLYTGHHCIGQAESDAAPTVSLTGPHDRLSATRAHHGRATPRLAARGLARVHAPTIDVAAELVGSPSFIRLQAFRPTTGRSIPTTLSPARHIRRAGDPCR